LNVYKRYPALISYALLLGWLMLPTWEGHDEGRVNVRMRVQAHTFHWYENNASCEWQKFKCACVTFRDIRGK